MLVHDGEQVIEGFCDKLFVIVRVEWLVAALCGGNIDEDVDV